MPLNTENLLLLATRLEQLPTNYNHFNMTSYVDTDDGRGDFSPAGVTKKVLHTCGTVACAAGHAPTIRGLNARKDEDWDDYLIRIFGFGEFSEKWDYAFGPDWAQDPETNTAHAAAQRLRYLAENGSVPDDY